MIEIDYIHEILRAVPIEACYELLAEECTELAHAALKMARAIRQENPTPVRYSEIEQKITEEASDVHLVARVLGVTPDPDIVRAKLVRWAERVEGVCAKSGDTLPYGASDARYAGRR